MKNKIFFIGVVSGVILAAVFLAGKSAMMQSASALTDLWLESGSNIYNANTGYVGIGTANPNAPLEIGKPGGIRFPNGSSGSLLVIPNVNQTFYLSQGSNELTLSTDGPGGRLLTFKSSGRIGIGTAFPSFAKVDIVTGDEPALSVRKTPSGTEALRVDGGYVYLYGGAFGFGTGDNADFTFRTNKTEKMRLTTNGSLGIGTVAPSAKLEVVGGPIKATGGLIIETRSSDPPNPVTGQMWLITQ